MEGEMIFPDNTFLFVSVYVNNKTGPNVQDIWQ